MLKIDSNSEKETINLGQSLIKLLKPGDIVCLFGALGSGKTVLVKGMAKGLGVKQDEVRSPSFVLIHEYHTAKNELFLYHLDLFRLNNIRDILELGYEDYFYGRGICVIEWAEKLGWLLPKRFLKIEMEIKEESKRTIKLIPKGLGYRGLASLRK